MPLSDSNLTTDKDETIIRIAGDADQLADVNTYSGTAKLETNATVIVEEIFGQDLSADSWYRIEHAGATNDTHTITIGATTNDPSSPDNDRPQYVKVITTTASEAGDELALRDLVIATLNADSNFSDYFKALKVKDNPIVHIVSKFVGEFWETATFTVGTTGTVDVTVGFDDFLRRGKPTKLARDIDDGRYGIIGISGEVQVTPGELSDRFFEHAMNGGSSKSLLVDGSVTPVVFQIDPVADFDTFVDHVRFHGSASSIKFQQFLAISTLTNGILVEIKSDDRTFSFDPILTTDDFQAEWNIGQPFELFAQPSAHAFVASFSVNTPFPLRATGTFSTDDYIKCTIRDDLTSVSLNQLELQAVGFKREL